MFNNLGKKIKALAKGLFWVEVAVMVLGVLAMADELFETPAGLVGAVLGLAIGVGVAYLSVLFLAAFGELVESTSAIKESNERILQKLNTPVEAPAAPQAPAARQHNAFCPVCGASVNADQYFCPSCGSKV